MKILALEYDIPNADAALFPVYGKQEAQRVWELYLAGIVRESYFRQDKHQAVLVLECDSVEEARIHLSSLPFVKHQLINFELIPLVPYPGFSRLFEQTT